jgi:hypothetical protein
MFFHLSPPTLRKLSAVKHALPVEALDITEDFADHDSDSDSDSKAVLDAFEVAPRLRSLRTGMSSHSIKIPLDQLEYLESFWSSRKGCVEWLHRCPDLIECELGVYETLDTELSPPLMACLPRLTKLEIVWKDTGIFILGLFNNLITPVLSDLRIEYTYVHSSP